MRHFKIIIMPQLLTLCFNGISWSSDTGKGIYYVLSKWFLIGIFIQNFRSWWKFGIFGENTVQKMIEYKYPCSPVSLSKSVGILGICIYQDTPFIS